MTFAFKRGWCHRSKSE